MLKATIVGAVAGLVGASVWAAVVYFAHIEIGWIAWGIGALVGAGVGLASGARAGVGSGVLAAAISIGAIAAGKLAAADIVVEQQRNATVASLKPATEEDGKIVMSFGRVRELADAGTPVDFLNGKRYEQVDQRGDFPPEVWAEGERRWASLTPDEQKEMLAAMDASIREDIDAYASSARMETFVAMFDLMDLLFGGLAVFSAYKLGSRVMVRRPTGPAGPADPGSTPGAGAPTSNAA